MNLDILKKAQNKVKRLNDIDNLTFLAMNYPKAKEEVIKLNQNQLKNFGIDSNGIVMETLRSRTGNVYADYTIEIKTLNNQPTDKVTLYDSGEFYDTFKVRVNKGYTEITANFQKENGSIMDNLPQNTEPLGLTDGSLIEFVRSTLLPIIADIMKRIIAE